MAKAKLFPIFAVALVVFGLLVAHGRAEDDCLAAPNARAPQGSHWYFHNDPIKQRKCWHLRTADQVIQAPNGGANLQPAAAGQRPPPAATQAAHVRADVQLRPSVQAAPDVPSGTITAGKTQDDSQPSRQDRTNSVPWADPPSPVSAGSIVWPDPPPLGNVTNGDAAENARNEKPNQKPEAPATADPSGTVSGDGSGDNNHLVKPAHTTARHTKVPGAVFLVLGSALVIGGVFLGVVVKAFLRRPAPHPDPRGTILAGTAGESGLEGDRSDRDVKEALSELLQVLNQQTT